jgi:hypothetical protein
MRSELLKFYAENGREKFREYLEGLHKSAKSGEGVALRIVADYIFGKAKQEVDVNADIRSTMSIEAKMEWDLSKLDTTEVEMVKALALKAATDADEDEDGR